MPCFAAAPRMAVAHPPVISCITLSGVGRVGTLIVRLLLKLRPSTDVAVTVIMRPSHQPGSPTGGRSLPQLPCARSALREAAHEIQVPSLCMDAQRRDD